MSTLKLKGSTSGYVELTAPATAGNNTITLPTTAGTVAVKDSSNNTEVGTGVTIGSPSSNTFTVSTNGSERVRVDSSGRLAVGTTSPGEPLSVATSSPGASATLARLQNTGTTSGTEARLLLSTSTSTGGTVSSGIACVATDAVGNTALALGSGTAGSYSEKARIDSSGRLLVGTATARTNFSNSTDDPQLQIESTNGFGWASIRNSNSTGGTYVYIAKSRGTGNVIVQNNDIIGGLNFEGNDGSEFVTAAQIRTDIDGTPGANDMPGRLVFSTTADGASSPTERMRIASTGAIQAFTGIEGGNFRSGNTTSSSEPALDVFGGASSTVSGTRTFSVRANGNVVNQNNSYGSLSDIKLKENIVDASSQWNDIKGLRPVNYNFKPETNQQTHTQIGLIAQEVELVSPGLVTETPDRDEEGNDLGTVTKSVNYSVLYMKAVKALQEAQERIETLEAENATLKNDFTALAARVTALESA